MGPDVERTHLSLAGEPSHGAPSAALKVGELVFAGGRIEPSARDAEAPSRDLHVEARRAFDALGDLMAMAGGDLGDVVDMITFHTDSRAIGVVFDVGREYFQSDFPAWTPVGVSAHRMPGARVAISAIGHLGDAPKQCIVPDTIKWWRSYPASAGCRKGELVFVGGQYGSDADGEVNAPGDHAGQARNALNRVAEICRLAGGELDDVTELLSFHQDPRWIPTVATVYEQEFFDESAGPGFPVWTAVGMPGLLKLGMLGQYRAVADLAPGEREGSTPSALARDGRHRSGAASKARGRLATATGSAPVDAAGRVAHRGDPDAQARAAFELVGESLAGLGVSPRRGAARLVSPRSGCARGRRAGGRRGVRLGACARVDRRRDDRFPSGRADALDPRAGSSLTCAMSRVRRCRDHAISSPARWWVASSDR